MMQNSELKELEKENSILKSENLKLKDIFNDIILMFNHHNSRDSLDGKIVVNKDKFIEYIKSQLTNIEKFKNQF